MALYLDPQVESAAFYGGRQDVWLDPSQEVTLFFHREKKMVGLLEGHVKASEGSSPLELMTHIPASYPEWLGDRSFTQAHKLRFPYIGGAMARGIASVELSVELAKSGMMGFFGAAGLSMEKVSAALDRLEKELGAQSLPYGVNLIHSPDHPQLEDRITDLLIERRVDKVSASAFMKVNRNIVRLALKGVREENGVIHRSHKIFAKVSRPEVARQFLSPAPENILRQLVESGDLSSDEAQLGRKIPLVTELIAESDSGGHTDNRPLGALLPRLQMLRDELCGEHNFSERVHIGAAGGLGSPASVAAAFAMGASFVVVGSVHQATVESGLSSAAKKMLETADIADFTMTPSADMFELGVKVQVLQRGSMLPVRGRKLYDLYRSFRTIEDIPAEVRLSIEKDLFRTDIDSIWEQTRSYFAKVDPSQLKRAEADSKFKMALIFRWYLGKSSQWPIVGDESRRLDYQVWSGPALGTFNRWVKGTFLEKIDQRKVRQVALNLLVGAHRTMRWQQLRTFGLDVPPSLFQGSPQFIGEQQ